MRAIVLACLLAGCAARVDQPAYWPAPVPPAPEAPSAEQIARDNQARAICQARGQLRERAQPYRGVLNLKNIVAGGEAMQICLDTYRATGIMPSY